MHTTAVHTTAATTPDVAALDDVEDILAANGATAAEHYVDEGYATAEAVDKAAHNGIELIGPLALNHSWQAKEGLSHSWTGREHPGGGGDGAAIRFDPPPTSRSSAPSTPSYPRSQRVSRQSRHNGRYATHRLDKRE